MTTLTWARVDANLASNHKTLTLIGEFGTKGKAAMAVYVFSLGYSIANGTDGFIPRGALGFIHGSNQDAKLLSDVGLWEEEPGGWVIHDWHEYQPSSEETKERSRRAREAANIRWAKKASKDA